MPDDWTNRLILAAVIIGAICLWLIVKSDEAASNYRADFERWQLAREHHDGRHAETDVAGCEWCGK